MTRETKNKNNDINKSVNNVFCNPHWCTSIQQRKKKKEGFRFSVKSFRMYCKNEGEIYS